MNSMELQSERENLSFDRVELDVKPPAEKSRQCPICHVYYKYGNSYWQHVRYVHASFLVQCVICEKCYKRTTMAKQHVLHSHKIAWHMCSNFVRKIRKSELEQMKENGENGVGNDKHETLKIIRRKMLHLIRSFNCYFCDNSFANINDLFKHVQVHKGECADFDSDNQDQEGEDEEEEEEPGAEA